MRKFGPGIVSGAADDDPAGITTYTLAGAQFGYTFLWASWALWPLMAFVQIMCAEMALITERSLTRILCQKLPRQLVLALILFAANTLNIAADLAGMADAINVVTGVPTILLVFLLAFASTAMIVYFNYQQIARVLIWLALFLFAYVITAAFAHHDWPAALRSTIRPSWPHTKEGWSMVVALLGTTVSPYLFFWQCSQEVEEMNQLKGKKRKFYCADALGIRKWDVGFGTLISNVIMFCVILLGASVLHQAGITKVESSREAAQALRPLLGAGAVYFYTVGLVGVGLLAIPTLSGSGAFALADFFHWRSGLDRKWHQARAFYGIILLSTVLALLVNMARINPVQALLWSAVANGIAAPPLLWASLWAASDKRLMKGKPIGRGAQAMVALTAALMTGAVVMYLVVTF